MYRGAGILFYKVTPTGAAVLLARRRRSGVWSIPGGGWDHSDKSPWATAARETREEFGWVPEPHQHLFAQRYPFGILGFSWTTFVVGLDDPPDIQAWPDRSCRDFRAEFRDASWFPIDALPPKTHRLLHPPIWCLKWKIRRKQVRVSRPPGQ